jgi:hypothetical protein
MHESKGLKDLNAVSKVVGVVGLAAVVGGIVRLATAPAELPFASPGWFESSKAHGDAVFFGITLLMLGGFAVLMSLLLSGRGRRAALAMQKQTMQALSEGVAAGLGTSPKARLDQLEELRRDGTLTEDEYRRKRAEIVAKI